MNRRRPLARVVLAVVVALASTGCWSFLYGAKGFEPQPLAASLGAQAILRVDEAGIPWGNGSLGSEIQRALLGTGTFQSVNYPVEPPDPPDLIVEVEALGSSNEAIAWSVLAAVATGYFYFGPVLVMPYFEDYAASCDVRVLRGAEAVHEFRVESKVEVVHALFAPARTYVAQAKERVFQDLADRIADGVASAKLPAHGEDEKSPVAAP